MQTQQHFKRFRSNRAPVKIHGFERNYSAIRPAADPVAVRHRTCGILGFAPIHAISTPHIPMSRIRRNRPHAERLSEVMVRLAETAPGTVTLDDIVATVGDRSFGALLVVLAVPNMVAGLIPGLSILLGVPLLLVSLQLLVGLERPWLPRRLARMEVSRSVLRRVIDGVLPLVRRLERALKPRLEFLTASWAERLIGLACLLLSVLVFLPIPFANLLPATGILLFGFSMLERDGLVALTAMGAVWVSAALFGGVAFAFLTAAGHTMRQLGLIGG
jgi:hypothetical protein